MESVDSTHESHIMRKVIPFAYTTILNLVALSKGVFVMLAF